MITLIAPIKPMARSAIHELVKGVMHAAATALRQRGPDFEPAATHLEQASTHWIRHTAGSHLSENVDLKVVRDNLGHANISTTSIYLHTEDDARHDATTSRRPGAVLAGARPKAPVSLNSGRQPC